MPKTHDAETVRKAIEMYRDGTPLREIKEALGIAESTIIRWAGPKRYRTAWRG